MWWTNIVVSILASFNVNTNIQILSHNAYTCIYNYDTKNPDIVAWYVDNYRISGSAGRLSYFSPDPNYSREDHGWHEDYTRSGYDRGHMCPAADNRCSKLFMEESFYTSNILPQLPRLNRSSWKKLEEKTRSLAKNNDYIVFSGPIYFNSYTNTIGESNIRVPIACWKIIVDSNTNVYTYIFGNMLSDTSMYNASINDLEYWTKVDIPDWICNEVVTNSVW